MNTYVDYEYYKDNLKCSIIPIDSFENYAIRASSKIRYYTSNRINDKNINDNIRNATCFIAELLFNQEKLKSKIALESNAKPQIASENLGPRSISYVNNTQYQDNQIKTDKELNSSIYQICKENIDSELLFRGV